MVFNVKDRVKQPSTTTGTTNMVVSGTSAGFQTFASALTDGDTTTYAITDENGNWETGLGTWTSSNSTLTRTTVYESSNSNNAVNFGSGTKSVFITSPASRSAIADQNGKTTFVDNIQVSGINVYKSTDPNITLRNTTAPSSTVVQLQGDASGTMWLLADGMNQANNSRIVMAVDGLEKFRINGGGSGNGAWGLGGQNYGTSGQVITSNGSTSAPTWQTPTVDLSAYSTTTSISNTYAPLSSPSLTGNPTVPTQTAGNSTTRIASTEFVSTAISNLVDSAPSTLDTLKELASALGDDVNFSTTVTNSIATKLPLAGGTMTGDLDMGSNDITTTGKMLYANMYANSTAYPTASTYHGCFIHDHSLGAGLFSHNGSWVRLANHSDLSNYLTTSSASSTYLTQANASSTYLTQSNASSTYLTQSNASSTYLTQSNASSTYMPKTGGTFTGDITINHGSGSTTGVINLGNSNGNGTLAQINMGHSGDTDHGNISYTGDMIFKTGGNSEKFRIGSSGQIGLSGANYGTSGQVLTSNGSSSAPTWQTVSGGSSGMPTSGGTFTGGVTFNNSATVHVDSMFTFDGQNNYGIDFQLRGNNYDLVWYSAANTLKAWDNTRIRWGSGNDFDIYHDGSQTNFHIEQGTAPIVFSNNSNSELLKIESTGAISMAGAFTFPTSDGVANQVLQTNGSGTVSWATVSSGGGGSMNDLIDDTTPQLGGTLDANSNQITNATTIGATKGVFTSGATGQLTLNSTSSDYMLEFQRSGTSEWWLKANSSNFAIHENGGADYLTVESGGNVGISQTNPLAKLDIKGDTSTFDGMAKIYLTDSNSNSNSRNWSIGNGGSAFGSLTFAVSTSKDGNAGDNTATNTMVITKDGNVGISQTNPSDKLEIQGSGSDGIRLSVSGQSYYHKIRSNGDGLLLSADDSDSGGAGADIRFHVANSEKVRITHDGAIGIGGTNYGSSGQVLTSNGSGSAPSWQTVSGGGGGGSGISVSDATALAFQCG